MDYQKHMNIYQIFDEMLEDVKYIKRTTFTKNIK